MKRTLLAAVILATASILPATSHAAYCSGADVVTEPHDTPADVYRWTQICRNVAIRRAMIMHDRRQARRSTYWTLGIGAAVIGSATLLGVVLVRRRVKWLEFKGRLT